MEPYQDFYSYLPGRTPLSMGVHAQDVTFPGYSWPECLVKISYYSREVIVMGSTRFLTLTLRSLGHLEMSFSSFFPETPRSTAWR